MCDAVRVAAGTLTRWPVPAPTRVDRQVARGAMLLAPWVGVALGTVVAAAAWLAAWAGLSVSVVAVLAVAAWAYASRGLHLDGLADTADGLGSGGGAERALEVMRRSDIGPFGVSTVVLVLAVQASALTQVFTAWGPTPVIAALAASRLALPLLCRHGVPAARPDGLGAAMAGSVPTPVAALDLVLTLGFTTAVLSVAGAPWWAGSAMTLAAAAAAAGTARVAARRFGGVTGDVLGAGAELALAAALLVLAAVSGWV